MAYSASKGAIDVLTLKWAAEFGSPGARADAIALGVVRGPKPARIQALPRCSLAHASGEAAGVHGTSLAVDGGRNTVAVSWQVW